MKTMLVTPPGMGSVAPDAEPQSEELSSVRMRGNWTYHAYDASHDGRWIVVHTRDGFDVYERGRKVKSVTAELRHHTPREFLFHPANEDLAFWGPATEDGNYKYVAVMNVKRLDDDEPWRVLYDPQKEYPGPPETPDHRPFGMEWSPKGDALYVIERVYPIHSQRSYSTAIVRIEYPSGAREQIVQLDENIDFFMPPVSRFQSGSGPDRNPFLIVFGARSGLYVTDPEGKRTRRVSTLPAVGLYNVEWNPNPDVRQLLLFFRRAAVGAGGRSFRGVWLVHLDRIGRPEEGQVAEQLTPSTDIHTLWYSPKGTYATWATKEEVAIRRPLDPIEETIYLEGVDEEGNFLDIKGVAWHDDEEHVAYTAGDRLFVYDLRADEVYALGRYGSREGDFAAEPIWIGDSVYMSVFEDLTHIDPHRPVFDVPGQGDQGSRRR